MTHDPDPPLRRASAHEQRRIDRYHAHPAKARGIVIGRRERLADLCGLLTAEDRRFADMAEYVARSALVLPMGGGR